MANIWEHPSIIAAEALRHLEDALVIGPLCAKDKTSEFTNKSNGWKVGDTVSFRTHGEYAVTGQDGEQCVLGKERLREGRQIRDRRVVRIRPPRRELERVRLLRHPLTRPLLLQMLAARGVGVVLGQCAVADHEELHIFEKPGPSPETLAQGADVGRRAGPTPAGEPRNDHHHTAQADAQQ